MQDKLVNKISDENKKSAFDPAACVFVSANAGAGKTSLLTNRVLSLLLHGVEPAKILCLTFTNAAAAEMSNRILQELGKWVMADEAKLYASVSALTNGSPPPHILARARGLFAHVLEAPEGVRIQTIHGFCQSLLRRFPLEAGISPHFTVMDSRSEQEALAEARLRLFNHARSHDVAIQNVLNELARTISEHSFNALMDEIIKNKRRFQSLLPEQKIAPNIRGLLLRHFHVAPDATPQSLFTDAFNYDEKTLLLLRTTVEHLLRSSKPTDINTATTLEQWLFAPHQREAMIEAYTSLFLTLEGEPRKKLFTKEGLADEALIDALHAEQQRVLAFDGKRRALAALTHTLHMLHIAEAMLAEYGAIKRAHAWMDYDDLILAACDLLLHANMSPWVLFKLDGGIDHILVDEAQDTSPQQWQIIQALTQEFFAGEGAKDIDRSLFIVGDEKQSIYSFQGADVEALGRMQHYFMRQIQDAHKQVFTLALTKSYRSTDEVLRAVDAIFSRPEASAGLTFDNTPLTHIPTRSGQAGLVELWPIIQPTEEEGHLSPYTKLAWHLAEKIHGWIENGEAKAGDIMVLVRSRTVFVDKLVRALKRSGVPVAGHDRMELNENLAVQDLIALGQILLLPEDDLTLAALLKSPICNVSEEELFTLAYGREQKTLWQRLQATGGQAYELLAGLRAKADFTPPFELYSHLLEELGARARFVGRMGDEVSDPIDEFLSQALLYERSHPPSLQGFLHWLTHSDSEIKRDMEQAKNAVRIMTIHGAKGLQSKIVILPDTIELPKERDSLLWLEEDNHILPVRSPSSSEDDALCARLRAERKEATRAEYRRLFYVALTRAEDRLYICGAKNKDSINDQSWYALAHAGLADIAEELPDGTLRLGQAVDGGRMTDDEKNAFSSPLIATHPSSTFAYLLQPPPTEPSPSQPLTPSRLSGTVPASASPLSAQNLYAAGQFIHLLLQHLPVVVASERIAAAQRLSRKFQPLLAPEILEKAMQDAIRVIEQPEFSFLFGDSALAEVPVAGMVEISGQKIAVSGQIDRLYIGNEIWIVDFKSNQLPPTNPSDIPPAYTRQLALYRALLAQIYPTKTITCGLLWTATAKLDVLPEASLDECFVSSYI